MIEVPETKFYEPWSPEVGQRVRVRLSGECHHGGLDGDPTMPTADGAVGTIKRVFEHGDRAHYKPGTREAWRGTLHITNGHRFVVFFDKGQPCAPDGGHLWLAAVELEPID